MKVLLCQDVERLGWYGDVVEVKDGYARNYLLPYGVATVPSDEKMKMMAKEKGKRAGERKLVLKQLERVAEAVEGAEVVVAAKANEAGHLFGSVGQRDIAQNLRDQGFEIKDSMVAMGEHIKEVGTHEIKLKVAQSLSATVSVVVVSQDENIESGDEDSKEESDS